MADMKQDVVAVLDVGKTNKKVLAYDRDLNLLDDIRVSLPAIPFEELHVEDTKGLVAWLKGALKGVSARHYIRAIAITTHGATCATLDEKGELSYPVIDYASAVDEQAIRDFFEEFGAEIDLHRETGTADFGFINVGKILYYLMTRKPDAWELTRHVLFYPQYLGYLITGAMAMDFTCLGNHTYLWDIEYGKWSSVGIKLGAPRMCPSRLSAPWATLGTPKASWVKACGLDPNCRVTVGIHDSNSSLLPTIAKGIENFVLNSTGTWCVGMRASQEYRLTETELLTKTFYQLDAFNRPLKTCIFLGGLEYESFSERFPGEDPQMLEGALEVVSESNLFIYPGVVSDGCIFPGSTPRLVRGDNSISLSRLKEQCPGVSSAMFYGALNISLAIQSLKMLELLGSYAGDAVYVEGGFRNNRVYMELLAAMVPNRSVVLTDLAEATAFGAALTGWMMVEGKDLKELSDRFSMNADIIQPQAIDGLDTYHEAWVQQLHQKA